MDNPATQPTRIRQLMPAGYLRILQTRTDCKQKATLNDVVLSESTNSKYWPAVEQLAQETDPNGFAAWQAAHLQPHQ
ncbi:hypothetical protein [Solirubrum puertoriconensis]|uniref:Uncharacterized protein n=1 Tax=Solirubrum puertoriconensis TaxID=1751427 RepID=A0A9X0HJB1_SOLP1|nr:hypothetical protein [Solirubrum puertoriconensis]KUG06909.1 hypothetical protein ASU33_06180 [Solirubrum puertoriconensis]